jgi:hypothetical protein
LSILLYNYLKLIPLEGKLINNTVTRIHFHNDRIPKKVPDIKLGGRPCPRWEQQEAGTDDTRQVGGGGEGGTVIEHGTKVSRRFGETEGRRGSVDIRPTQTWKY